MTISATRGVTSVWPQPVWWDDLPREVPGLSLRRNEPLAAWTTIKVGGPGRGVGRGGWVGGVDGLLRARQETASLRGYR